MGINKKKYKITENKLYAKENSILFYNSLNNQEKVIKKIAMITQHHLLIKLLYCYSNPDYHRDVKYYITTYIIPWIQGMSKFKKYIGFWYVILNVQLF